MVNQYLASNRLLIDTTCFDGVCIPFSCLKRATSSDSQVLISRPIFNKNHSAAIIEVEFYEFGSSAGYTYIVSKENNLWKTSKRFVRWIE